MGFYYNRSRRLLMSSMMPVGVVMKICGDIQILGMVCMRAGSWTRQVKS